MTPELWVPTTGRPFYGTVERLMEFGTFRFMPGGMSVSEVRNRIVVEFLKGDSDILVMCDDDVIPPYNLYELFDPIEAGEFQVVSGVVLTARPGQVWMPNVFTRGDDGRYSRMFGESGVAEADAVGTGLIAIHRSMLEGMSGPFNFRLHQDGTIETGEDFAFCERVRARKGRVAAHFGVFCEHYDDIWAGGMATAYMQLVGQLSTGGGEDGVDSEAGERSE